MAAPVRDRRGPQAFATSWFSLRRLFATAIRECLELIRDPIRLGFALFGTTLLMLVFGFGISTDVNNLSFAVLDHDQSPESRAYLEELRGSTYFVERDAARGLRGSQQPAGRAETSRPAIEIPPNFGRDIKRGRPVWVGAWVDGAMPFRAETIRGYLAGHASALSDRSGGQDHGIPGAQPPANIEVQIQVQPGLRQHLHHGSVQHGPAAWRCSRRS